MRINKILFFTFITTLLTTRIFSVNWEETGDVSLKKDAKYPKFSQQVVIDSEGNSTAFWLDDRDNSTIGLGNLKAATLKVNTKKWVPTSNLVNYPTEGAYFNIYPFDTPIQNCQIAISTEGIVAAIWLNVFKNDPTTYHIKTSMLFPGSQKWEKSKTVSIINKTVTSVAIGFDINSRLHAVFINNDRQIAASYLNKGASKWSVPITISGESNKFDKIIPKMTTNPNQDRVVVTWIANNQLYSSYLTPVSNKWSVPIKIGNSQRDLLEDFSVIKQVTIGPNENYAITTLAESTEDGNFNIKYAVLDRSNQWTSPELLSIDEDYGSLDFAISEALITTFIYSLFDNGVDSKLFSKNLLQNGTLSKPVTLSTGPTSQGFVSVDATGKFIATWYQKSSEIETNIFLAEKPSGQKWSLPTLVSKAKFVNALSTNAAGSSVILVESNKSGILKAFIVGILPACINGKSGTDKFLLQQTNFNEISWCASPSKNVVKYSIFRGNKKIGTVASTEPLIFRDENIPKGNKIIYGVKAVTNNGASSDPLTITLPKIKHN